MLQVLAPSRMSRLRKSSSAASQSPAQIVVSEGHEADPAADLGLAHGRPGEDVTEIDLPVLEANAAALVTVSVRSWNGSVTAPSHHLHCAVCASEAGLAIDVRCDK